MRKFLLFLLILFLSSNAGHGDEINGKKKQHVNSKWGYIFVFPNQSWNILQNQEQSGSHVLVAQNPVTGGLWVVVVSPIFANSSLDALAQTRKDLHVPSFGSTVTKTEIKEVTLKGEEGKQVEITYGAPEQRLAESLFIKDQKLYLLQSRYRTDRPETVEEDAALRKSFRWLKPGEIVEEIEEESEEETTQPAPPQPPPIPIPEKPACKITKGRSGRIILVRTSDSFEADTRRFCTAMPLSNVSGAPVCLLVEETLSASQVDLLNRLPVREIIAVGAPPAEIERYISRRVEDPEDLYEPSDRAIVSSPDIGDILEAAPAAFRMGVPLVVDGPHLGRIVKKLHPAVAEDQPFLKVVFDRYSVTQVITHAQRDSVKLPVSMKNSPALGDPITRWKKLNTKNGEPAYLAVANIGASRSEQSGTALGAALLAARHRGMLLVMDKEVHFAFATLDSKADVPDSLAGIGTGEFITGDFELPEGLVNVAVPVVGQMIGMAGQTNKYGDAIVDFDLDGTFDPKTETVPAGDVRYIGGTPYSLSIRLIGAVGVTKFHDAMATNRAVALSPPAESIAAELSRIYEGTSLPGFLLLAGDHKEIPFDYVKDPVYAESTMHEQELASDNLYADPDGDRYLDIAVGRFVSTSPAEATSIASRISAYAALEGAWRKNALLLYPAWHEDETRLLIPIVFASFEALMRGLHLDLQAAGYDNRLYLLEKGDLPDVYPDLAGNAVILFSQHAGPTMWLFRMVGRSRDQLRILYPARSHNASRLGPGCGVVPPLQGAPVVMCGGCDSAGLDYEVPWTESIVHSFFEQGAVAYFGNTRAGFPDTEEFLFRETLQTALGLAHAPGEGRSLGEAFRKGKNFLQFLIRNRGPFSSTPPFEEYTLSMQREWHSLVYYGDPALDLTTPRSITELPVALSVEHSAEGKHPSLKIRVELNTPITQDSVCIMEQVGLGPKREITALSAPGLCYGSVPWGTYADSAKPGPVLPGVFLDLPLADEFGEDPEISLEEGPAWALGGSQVLCDGHGKRRLLLSIDLIRYAMAKPQEHEVAETVVILVAQNASNSPP